MHSQDGQEAPEVDCGTERRPTFSLATDLLGYKVNVICLEAQEVVHKQITIATKTVRSYSLFH